MKNVLIIFAIFFSLSKGLAQVDRASDEQEKLNYRYSQIQTYGSALLFINPKRQVEGTIYLLPKWKNLGVITTKDGEQLLVRNINLNVQDQAFESKFAKDSTHQFSFDNLSSIAVNNVKYKQFIHQKEQRIFESIYEHPDFEILKLHKTKMVAGSANPMVNRPNNKVSIIKTYYIKTGEKFKRFNLNERNLVNLLKDYKVSKEVVTNFATRNNLSFKEVFDVQQMLKHFLTN